MKTLNWKERYVWVDSEDGEIANPLMQLVDDELSLTEVRHWYEEGFYLRTKSTDEIEANYPLSLEDVEKLFLETETQGGNEE